MTPRHQQLINLFDALVHSGKSDVSGVRVFNSGTMSCFTLYEASAKEMRNLMLAESAIKAMKALNKIDDWHTFLSKHGRVVLQPDKPAVSGSEFKDIVTTAMEVAKAANWTRQYSPQSDAFMERVLVGAVVAYVMNRFEIKRV